MEFIILKNTEVTFPSCITVKSEGNLRPRLSTPLHARIQTTKKKDGSTNAYYVGDLTTTIIANPWTNKDKGHVVNWEFKVGISLPDSTTEHNGQGNPSTSSALTTDGSFCSMTIKPFGEKSSSFLRIILNLNSNGVDKDCEKHVTMKVIVKKFGETDKSTLNWPPISLKPKSGEFKSDVAHCQRLMAPEESTLLSWKAGKEFSGIFTISVVLSNKALSLLNSINVAPNSRLDHLKMLLKDEICTDTEILVGMSPNQKAIKCHRVFLVAESSVFRKMFESGLKEARENKVEMVGISENGVRALLAYLYHYEMRAAYESSEIALELLQAAEKYDVKGLEDAVREIILARESIWFGVDMVVSLYIFAKKLCPDEGMEDEELMDVDDEIECDSHDGVDEKENENSWVAVKVKALKVLKWYTQKKPKALMNCVKYQQVVSGKLGVEVYSEILRLK